MACSKEGLCSCSRLKAQRKGSPCPIKKGTLKSCRRLDSTPLLLQLFMWYIKTFLTWRVLHSSKNSPFIYKMWLFNQAIKKWMFISMFLNVCCNIQTENCWLHKLNIHKNKVTRQIKNKMWLQKQFPLSVWHYPFKKWQSSGQSHSFSHPLSNINSIQRESFIAQKWPF